MEIFRLEATSRTPEVELNPEQGTLSMIGESYPEDIRTYYEPIMVALEQFAATQPSDFKITIKLTYFNSGSARALMELLDAIDEAAQGNFNAELNWYCDPDDDITREFVEDIAADLSAVKLQILDLDPDDLV